MPGFELFEPVFRTRFTDLGATMFTHQKMGKCGDFELKMMNCMEAYGKPLGDTKCKDLVDDFSDQGMLFFLVLSKKYNRKYI